MKSFRYITIVLIIIFSFNFQSCIKENSNILPEGNIVGYVYTFNEFRELQSDHSGVQITTNGISEKYQTLTDKSGRFELKDIPAGTYDLNFVKKGYSLLRQFGIQHLGGEPTVLGMPFDYSGNGSAYFLLEIPSTLIQNIWIKNDSVYCEFKFTKSAPYSLGLKLSFSLTENFNLLSPDAVASVWVRAKGAIFVGKLNFYNPPFRAGERVYFRAQVNPYSASGISIFNNRVISGIQYYFDYESNSTIYPTLGKESAQYSFFFQE